MASNSLQKMNVVLFAITILVWGSMTVVVHAQTPTAPAILLPQSDSSSPDTPRCTAEFCPLAETQGGPLGDLYNTPADGDLSNFINRLFKFALIIGAIGAVLRIAYAGYLYMGSDMWGQKSLAKEILTDVALGLLLLLSIWIILNQINPQILELKALDVIKENQVTMPEEGAGPEAGLGLPRELGTGGPTGPAGGPAGADTGLIAPAPPRPDSRDLVGQAMWELCYQNGEYFCTQGDPERSFQYNNTPILGKYCFLDENWMSPGTFSYACVANEDNCNFVASVVEKQCVLSR